MAKGLTLKQREYREKLYGILLHERQRLLASQGIKKTLAEIERSQRWKEIVAALNSRQTSGRSEKARALIDVGRRDASWTFPIGESPKTRRRRRRSTR
jgi:hypothetical protein